LTRPRRAAAEALQLGIRQDGSIAGHAHLEQHHGLVEVQDDDPQVVVFEPKKGYLTVGNRAFMWRNAGLM